jgi:hypothetical protein
MEWIICLLCGFCLYLFIEVMRLGNQIAMTESKFREDLKDKFSKEVLNTLVKLSYHTHDQSTGYVDKASIMDRE